MNFGTSPAAGREGWGPRAKRAKKNSTLPSPKPGRESVAFNGIHYGNVQAVSCSCIHRRRPPRAGRRLRLRPPYVSQQGAVLVLPRLGGGRGRRTAIERR